MKKNDAIILVDPVSSGRFLKPYISRYGCQLIGVFTLAEEDFKNSGKYLPYQEKIQYCDVVINNNNYQNIIDTISKLSNHIKAVIPASEPGVELADKLSNYYCVRGNDPCSSLVRRDKYEMRLASKKNGLVGPDFQASYSEEGALQFAQRHILPIMLKTPKGGGAHHVFTCHSLEEVSSAHSQIVNDKNIFGEVSPFSLAEEFIPGTQYAIELFGDGCSLHITGIWKLFFNTNIQGKSMFDSMETLLDWEDNPKLQQIIKYSIQAAIAAKVTIGPCLIELRDHPERGPMLIEIGARLSGIDMPLLIKESSNFNPFDATIQVYMNSDFVLPQIKFNKKASIVFCPIDGYGTVRTIEGLEEIKKLPSYISANLTAKIGQVIAKSYDLATIPLYVYLAHSNEEQLKQDLKSVRQLFNIIFE